MNRKFTAIEEANNLRNRLDKINQESEEEFTKMSKPATDRIGQGFFDALERVKETKQPTNYSKIQLDYAFKSFCEEMANKPRQGLSYTYILAQFWIANKENESLRDQILRDYNLGISCEDIVHNITSGRYNEETKEKGL